MVLSVKDDAQLVQQTLSGDAEAFGELVLRYQDRLFAMLVHVTGSHEQAEEATQEAFVQAFSKLDTFAGRSGFFTWIYRIAYNRWVSSHRRRRPSLSVEDLRDNDGFEPSEEIDTPWEQMERAERVEVVRKALHQLPAEHRSILLLREMENRSYEEIAVALDMPLGTVRSRIHRARLLLKQKLQIILQEPGMT